MNPLILSNFTVTTAAGCGNQANLNALIEQKSGLKKNDFLDIELDTWIGRVNDIEQCILPQSLIHYQCRNNQLACLALHHDDFINTVQRAKKQYGSHRVAVFMGTSTSGILSTELAYRGLVYNQAATHFKNPDTIYFREQHNSFSLADFIQHYFHLTGPAQVISTACSSSAKVFASASRYIEAGLCDAAIVGGVDSLCLTTMYGFNSLELISDDICRPADKNRKGLSIGEAAAFALLEKPQNTDYSSNMDKPVYLRSYGESSDAYHMSTPHPEGLGAIKAMQDALSEAKLTAAQIDYINLHGTATPVNDKVEDIALNHVFSNQTRCSSSKGWTGHTLGAAGAVEAVYSTLCIQNDLLPVSLNTQQLDPEFKANIIENPLSNIEVHTIASNSFGFGGNNCCLIFSDSDEFL